MKVGSRTLASYQYGPNNGLLLSQTYGNGDIVSFTYDTLGRVKTTTYDDGRVLLYTYNGEGRLYSVTETLGEDVVTYVYNYDTIGRLISSEKKAGTTSLLRTHQSYDAYNRLVGQSWKLGDSTYSESYTYNDVDNSISTFTAGNGETIELTYDLLRRLSSVDAGLYGKDYTYREISEVDQTTQITGLEYVGLPEDLEFGYTYNNLGYIATYAAPGEQTITYTYDNLGQLLQAVGDVTYTYTYDSAGNILTANGHTYTYGDADWKDLLTAFDNQAITYDAIGNPLSYYNGTRWTFTWENGRSLATATNGTVSLSYEYDLDGLRTTKTVGNAVHDYYYAGGRLLREVITTTAEDETVTTATLDFFYDASGQPYVLKYNGVEYYYITNLQGDVVSLVNPTTGAPVATYEYDPFGKVISATGDLAAINPLRYRGYYYDTETSFYYLQSRYYDPAICRFINADSMMAGVGGAIQGTNLYAYCFNNPISLVDSAGSWPQWLTDFVDWVSGVFTSSASWGSVETKQTSVTAQGPSFSTKTDLGACYSKTEASLGYFTAGLFRGQHTGSLDGGTGKTTFGPYLKASILNYSIENGCDIFGVKISHKEVLDIGTSTANAGLKWQPTLKANLEAKAAVASARGTYCITAGGYTLEIGINLYYYGYGWEAGKGASKPGSDGFSIKPIIRITPV